MTQCMKISGIELKKQSAEPQCERNSTQSEYPLDVVYLPKQRGTTHQQVWGGVLLHILAENSTLSSLSLMHTGLYTHTHTPSSMAHCRGHLSY